jgi:hypothetical protein
MQSNLQTQTLPESVARNGARMSRDTHIHTYIHTTYMHTYIHEDTCTHTATGRAADLVACGAPNLAAPAHRLPPDRVRPSRCSSKPAPRRPQPPASGYQPRQQRRRRAACKRGVVPSDPCAASSARGCARARGPGHAQARHRACLSDQCRGRRCARVSSNVGVCISPTLINVLCLHVWRPFLWQCINSYRTYAIHGNKHTHTHTHTHSLTHTHTNTHTLGMQGRPTSRRAPLQWPATSPATWWAAGTSISSSGSNPRTCSQARSAWWSWILRPLPPTPSWASPGRSASQVRARQLAASALLIQSVRACVYVSMYACIVYDACISCSSNLCLCMYACIDVFMHVPWPYRMRLYMYLCVCMFVYVGMCAHIGY